MDEDVVRTKVFKLIDDKREDLMKLGNHLNVVSEIIKKLNQFINVDIDYPDKYIEDLLEHLIQYRVVLDIPIPTNTLLIRARKFDDPFNYPEQYTDASEISYIPENMPHKVSLGRFNKEKNSMYYGCISKSIKNSNVAFSETDAKENEYINVLVSYTKMELKVRYIGLFDYYKRGTVAPFSVHSLFEDIDKYYQVTHEEELLSAIELCDAFFFDITTRKGHDRLYRVTSILSSIFLEDKHVDGLIYPSVETIGSPNVVLKPASVDEKVLHKEVRIFLIEKNYGYSLYRAMDSYPIGLINSQNYISWGNLNDN